MSGSEIDIVQELLCHTRKRLQIVSYKKAAPDCIVHGNGTRLYHTWASMKGVGKRKRGSPMYLRSRVKSECNTTCVSSSSGFAPQETCSLLLQLKQCIPTVSQCFTPSFSLCWAACFLSISWQHQYCVLWPFFSKWLSFTLFLVSIPFLLLLGGLLT